MHFTLVTLCTCFNMFVGLLALYFAIIGNPLAACCALCFSVVFDACDGFLARKWGVASEFGAQLDSIADYASFCLAGGSLAYAWTAAKASGAFSAFGIPDITVLIGNSFVAVCTSNLGIVSQVKHLFHGIFCGEGFPPLQGGFNYLMLLIAFYYICLGGMRLARYNAKTDSLCPPSFFEGLPTTGAAAILALLCIGDYLTPEPVNFLSPAAIAVLTCVLGSLMFCRLPYPKLTKMSWIPKWWFALPFVVAVFSIPLAVYAVCGLYMISGPIYYFINKKKQADTESDS
ncbi:CDP-alcohol phosphatidyltransferase family protein [bacterium]|nr:CDP-alcohol phosphatidyltransferase family protein [bacterium]